MVKSDISIHAPREGGDVYQFSVQKTRQISIHAPREGGDWEDFSARHGETEFQSTPPARGATDIISALASGIGISIHAPREGGDSA